MTTNEWDGATLETRLRSYSAAPAGKDALSVGYVCELMREAADALTTPPRPDHAGGVEAGPVNINGTLYSSQRAALKAMFGPDAEFALPAQAPAQAGGLADAIRSVFGDVVQHWLRHGETVGPQRVVKGCNFDELRDNLIAALTPAQAPDKAAEREGVGALWDAIHESMVCAWNLLDGTQDDASGVDQADWDALSSAMITMGKLIPRNEEPFSPSYAVPYLRATLAPEPTGTEAGRGSSFPPATCNTWEDCHHDGVCHDFDQCGIKGPNEPDDEAATPTPPTPDSTGQGDGTSQEGGR